MPLLYMGLQPLLPVVNQTLQNQYVFDPAKLQEISQKAIAIHGNNTESLMRRITWDLKEEYGDAISNWTREDWFFNNAGGAMVPSPLLPPPQPTLSPSLSHTNPPRDQW